MSIDKAHQPAKGEPARSGNVVEISEIFVASACLLMPSDDQVLNAGGVQALQKLFEVFG
jgi:hypothetical protein